MDNRKCYRCGFTYDFQTYSHRCPHCGWREMDSSSRRREDDLDESQWGKLYGPPPINNHYENDGQHYLSDPHITLYGPRPIDSLLSPQKWYKRPIIVFVIGVLLGGIIVWLFGYYSDNSQPTVYGPIPVDSMQTIVPMDND